jgi:predicted helicase
MDEKLWLQKGDGSAYEAYVAGAIATSNPGLAVQRDVRMPGRKSERMRQIDILLGEPGQVAVECKYFHRKVDVKAVEAFLGMMDDVGIRKGLIVTSRGFTAAAAKRAANDDRHLNLHTIAPDRLSDYQFVGTPLLYRGSIAISLDCPKHWVVDTEHPDALMMM